MSWIDSLKINELIAVVGVLTGLIGAATAIITAQWNRRAVVSEEAFATLKQQMDLIKQQAAQTEANLREQLAYYKDLSPADIQKQLTAVKSLLTDRIRLLETELATSNQLLRDQAAEISESKISIATALGWGRIFLGVNDAELLTRALTGLIASYGEVIDFGEVDLSVKSFYVGLMRLLIRNETFLAKFIRHAPEWILDCLILPMLGCAKYKTLAPAIAESLGCVFQQMEKTPFAGEVPIFLEALERAKSGEDFSSLSLPNDLAIKLSRTHRIDYDAPC